MTSEGIGAAMRCLRYVALGILAVALGLASLASQVEAVAVTVTVFSDPQEGGGSSATSDSLTVMNTVCSLTEADEPNKFCKIPLQGLRYVARVSPEVGATGQCKYKAEVRAVGKSEHAEVSVKKGGSK